MNPDPIEYRSPQTQSPPGTDKRSLGKWILILILWGVGTLVWVFYLGLVILLIIRIL